VASRRCHLKNSGVSLLFLQYDLKCTHEISPGILDFKFFSSGFMKTKAGRRCHFLSSHHPWLKMNFLIK
jgi:hypothetical protein